MNAWKLAIIQSLANFVPPERQSFWNKFSKLLRVRPDRLYTYYDLAPRFRHLLNDKIAYLDLGARRGIPDRVQRYADFLEFFLFEPEPEEAELLRNTGENVFDTSVFNFKGEATLFVTRSEGSSSLLHPTGAFSSYFYGKTDQWRQIEVVREVPVNVDTLDNLFADFDRPLGVVKIDCQGAEYEIVEGMVNLKPLFVTLEASCAEFYVGQKPFPLLAYELYNRGYLMFDFAMRQHRPGGYSSGLFLRNGIPSHGDVSFMPDWSREAGLHLILDNDRSFSALMLLFGMEDVLLFLLDEYEFPNESIIREAMEIDVKLRFRSDLYSSDKRSR